MTDERRTAQLQAYHAGHAAKAQAKLAGLAAIGKTVSTADARRCDDYAIAVLGGAHFSPWLKVYCAFRGAFADGWIPDNFYGARVVPEIQGQHGRSSFLKSLAAALFGDSAFPDVGVRIHGKLFDTQYRLLTAEQAREVFFAEAKQILFKPDGTGRGQGIVQFEASQFTADALARLGDGVFQRRITQHPDLARFTPDAVATLRLTSVIESSGEPAVRAAYLGMALGGETHFRSGAGILVDIDPSTGLFGDQAVRADWTLCPVHPATGEAFAGRQFPAFDDCLRTVLRLHRKVAYVGAVGWDVAVGEDGSVHILEWNGFHNGIKFSEAAQGPCFRGLDWERFAPRR